MSKNTLMFFLTLLLSLVANAAAVDVTNVIAVLDVEVSDGSITADEAEVLSSSIRGETVTAAKLGSIPVMTRETMVDLAPPEILRCSIGSCIATVGKMLQARYVLGIRVARVDSRLSLTVEVYASKSGVLLGTKVFRGGTVSDLQDDMEGSLSELIRMWLEQASGVDRLVTTATEMVRVRFESIPPGAYVMADTGPVCNATPCDEVLPVGDRQVTFYAKEYDPISVSIMVKVGLSPIIVKLVPNFAKLSIITEPPGLRVLVDGQSVGQSPVQSLHLLPGGHEVLVDDPCYGKVGERIGLM